MTREHRVRTLGEPSPAENIARRFHEIYETAAPHFDYETRRESAVLWEDVPENNRRLMVYVVEQILDDLKRYTLELVRASNPDEIR